MEFPRDPAIPLFGVYPSEMKPRVNKIVFMSVHGGILHDSQKGDTNPNGPKLVNG